VSRVRGNASYAADIIDAGLDELRASHGCDDFVIIGFCSGGTIVLNYVAARPEIRADLKGIVSIHGGLTSRDAIDADRSSSSTRILVLSGGDDDAQSNVADLEADLDSTGLTWEMTRYADTPHAWTNVASSRYRYRADSRTWGSVDFFLRDVLLGEVEAQRGASADRVPHIARIEVNYTSPVDGTNLSSYLYWDKSTRQARPLVLVAPDWTGLELEADGYEMTRAEMLAAEGFAAFGMDIFGEGYHHVPSIETRISLVNQYLSSPDLVLDRYESALAAATGLPPVDATKVALFGYCFGGSASFHVHALTEAGHALRGVVSFHGGLSARQPIAVDLPVPLLVQSGAGDDAVTDVHAFEDDLNAAEGLWEITRYSDTVHGFTEWDSNSPPAVMYNPTADARSWHAALTFLRGPDVFGSSPVSDVLELLLAGVDADIANTRVLAGGQVTDANIQPFVERAGAAGHDYCGGDQHCVDSIFDALHARIAKATGQNFDHLMDIRNMYSDDDDDDSSSSSDDDDDSSSSPSSDDDDDSSSSSSSHDDDDDDSSSSGGHFQWWE
jgi:dienelactone hydrolase